LQCAESLGRVCEARSERQCKKVEATLDFKQITAKEASGTYEMKVDGWQTPWTGSFHVYYAN
jgi:hypothetical protein